MLYGAEFAGCSEIQAERHALWAECRSFLILDLVLHKVTNILQKVNSV
jgi:hypothetical protein